MNYVMIRHKVKDFKKWKAAYDAHGPARDGVGLKERCLLRNTKSRNDVWILFEANNLARAKAFCASADLRAAMKKAGVTGSRSWPSSPTHSRGAAAAWAPSLRWRSAELLTAWRNKRCSSASATALAAGLISVSG